MVFFTMTAETANDNPVSSMGTDRDLRLDALRGLALWFIFLDHVPDNIFAWLTLRNYGFSDTTELFVFVSGYTCALAYGCMLQEQGWLTITTRALHRSWEIYVGFLLLVVVYLGLIQLMGPNRPYIDETNTAIFFQDPGGALLHVLTMQYAPVNTDVLPTFVLFHLLFPAVLFLMLRAKWFLLLTSFLIYTTVQIFGVNLPAWPGGQWFFNPLAWQFLFVMGVVAAMDGGTTIKTIRQSRILVAVAVIYLLASLFVTMSWQFKALEVVPEFISNLIYPIDKSNLAPARLLHFIALAIVVTHFAERELKPHYNPFIIAAVRCGENSLAIYILSVLLSLLAHAILVESGGAVGMQLAVSLIGIAIMAATGSLMTAAAKSDARGPKLF